MSVCACACVFLYMYVCCVYECVLASVPVCVRACVMTEVFRYYLCQQVFRKHTDSSH